MSNNEFSFLQYINHFSQENLLIISKKAAFKNRDEFSKYVGYSIDTVDAWFAKSESRRKTPTVHSWNYVLLQLEARRKGYGSLVELVASA